MYFYNNHLFAKCLLLSSLFFQRLYNDGIKISPPFFPDPSVVRPYTVTPRLADPVLERGISRVNTVLPTVVEEVGVVDREEPPLLNWMKQN